jgi:DNA-binding NarL/FixJ family response regulator
MVKKIKVILVDDHDILMDGIESILNEASQIEVTGKASTAAIAETLIRQHLPDLVITDISLGKVSGLELTKYIMHHFPLVKVMVLSMHDDVQHISSLLEAGAMGYLLKNIKQDELFLAIENVMAGRQYIQQSVAGSYTKFLQVRCLNDQQSPLSPREIEILRLIALDLTTTEISRRLFISEHTVCTHRKNIGRKTGVKTVVGLLNYAREQGLL